MAAINPLLFNAALAGYLSGMFAGQNLEDPTDADYENSVIQATAYATALDIAIGADVSISTAGSTNAPVNGVVLNNQSAKVGLLQSLSFGIAFQRYLGPLPPGGVFVPTDFTTGFGAILIDGVLALYREAIASMQFSAGVTPPAPPAGPANFANFFALMPGDNTATIAAGAPVLFPQTGPTSGTILPLSTSTFSLPAVGTYHVEVQVSVAEPGQLQLAIGGTGLPNTVAGRATGTSQIVISTDITTVAPNSVLSVINPAGNPAALTITPTAGGTHAVSATLSITQVG